jgi:hypothetical protein
LFGLVGTVLPENPLLRQPWDMPLEHRWPMTTRRRRPQRSRPTHGSDLARYRRLVPDDCSYDELLDDWMFACPATELALSAA